MGVRMARDEGNRCGAPHASSGVQGPDTGMAIEDRPTSAGGDQSAHRRLGRRPAPRRVGALRDLPGLFETLRGPNDHCKVLVNPHT
jgi:hypothetical protein